MHINYKSKILSQKQLLSELALAKYENKKIAFTNGCFDIIHIGHINLLYKAATLSDLVIVAINSDKSVKKNKGKLRPIVNEEERAEVIASLEYVDFVTIFDEKTPIRLIKQIIPDILLKGGDWKKKDIVGADVVESHGGSVFNGCYVSNKSSSNIIDRIRNIELSKND